MITASKRIFLYSKYKSGGSGEYLYWQRYCTWSPSVSWVCLVGNRLENKWFFGLKRNNKTFRMLSKNHIVPRFSLNCTLRGGGLASILCWSIKVSGIERHKPSIKGILHVSICTESMEMLFPRTLAELINIFSVLTKWCTSTIPWFVCLHLVSMLAR